MKRGKTVKAGWLALVAVFCQTAASAADWTWTGLGGSANWTDPSNWRMSSSGEVPGTAYPDAPDDIARIHVDAPFPLAVVIPEGMTVTVGQLWIGTTLNQDEYKATEELPAAVPEPFSVSLGGSGTLRFASSKRDAELHLDSTTTNTTVRVHVFGSESDGDPLKLELASSLAVDMGMREAVSPERLDLLAFSNVVVNVQAERTLSFAHAAMSNDAVLYGVDFTPACRVTGAGRIVNRSAATVGLNGDWSAFTGECVESGCGHDGFTGNLNANMFQSVVNNPAARLSVRGYPQLNTRWAGNTFRGNMTAYGTLCGFAGFVRVGGAAEQNPGNRLNYGEVNLEGGYLELRPDAVEGWTDPTLVTTAKRLVAREGFSGLGLYDTSVAEQPANVLVIEELSNANGAMMSIHEPLSSLRMTDPALARGHVRVRNFSDLAVGGYGDPTQPEANSRNQSIIPWLISPRHWYKNGMHQFDPQFFTADGDGLLLTVTNRFPSRLQNMQTAEDNVALTGQYEHLSDLNYAGTSTPIARINSLYMRNVGGAKHYLRSSTSVPMRRLEITSGGVILSFYGLLGWVDDPGEGVESKAGEIYFPTRGYIWEVHDGEDAKGGQVWEKLIAPQGVSVAAVNRNTAKLVLGGDQRGIEKDLTVNAGRLVLGNATTGCKVSCPIRVVGASSTLEIPTPSAYGLRNNQVILRDIGGYPAKIAVVDADTTVVLKDLWIEEDDGTLRQFRPGIYAAAAAKGVDYVDPHFTGAGRVHVPWRGTSIVIR